VDGLRCFRVSPETSGLLGVATSMRFEEVVKGLFFAIHPVIFARIQHDFFLSSSHAAE